jgi:hypothetical protein
MSNQVTGFGTSNGRIQDYCMHYQAGILQSPPIYGLSHTLLKMAIIWNKNTVLLYPSTALACHAMAEQASDPNHPSLSLHLLSKIPVPFVTLLSFPALFSRFAL